MERRRASGSGAGAGGTNVDGGIVNEGTGGSGGSIGMTQGDVGGMTSNPDAGDDRQGGDFDHLPDEFPNPQLGSSFFWGGPNDIHLGIWFVASPSGTEARCSRGTIEPPRGDSTLACHVKRRGIAEGLDLFAELNHHGAPRSAFPLRRHCVLRHGPPPSKLAASFSTTGTGIAKEEGATGQVIFGVICHLARVATIEVPFAESGARLGRGRSRFRCLERRRRCESLGRRPDAPLPRSLSIGIAGPPTMTPTTGASVINGINLLRRDLQSGGPFSPH